MSREMIDSNAGWIGSIPSEWSAYKLLYALERPIFDGPHETPTVVDNGIPFISVDSVNDTKNVDLNVCKKFISEEDFNEYYKKTPLKQGDVLFTKAATIGKTAIVDDRKYMVWSPLAILRSGKHVNNEYLYYVLNCPNLIDYTAHFLGNSATQINVGMRELERAKLPVPPLSEQRQIVHFLDRKCSAIDTAIEKTKESIEKLEEYKKAVITKAVTKGLDPDAKMKDSGIEWIGEVPEGWEVKRLKYLFYINSGATPKSDNTSYWDGNIKWVTPADFVTEQKWLSGGKRNITEEGYNSCSATIVPSGSIIFSKRAPVGLVVLSAEPLCTNQGCLACVPKTNVEAEYYYYVMSVIPEQFERLASGTTFKEISLTEFMNFKIPAPSIKEQRKIVEKLKERCSSIDSLIAEKQTAIDKWAEYKKSLIYYVVTGKIDCRGESI